MVPTKKHEAVVLRKMQNPLLGTRKRFWSKVNKTKSCWFWNGQKSYKGYGIFEDDDFKIRAHRIAFIMQEGIEKEISKIDSISFTVPGNPVGKERARTVIRDGQARSYTPSKTKNYEQKVAMFALDAMKQAGWKTIEGPVGIEISSYKLIPQSRRKQLVEGQVCPEKPDHDNIAKAVCDALNYAQAAVYNDDSQIVECHSRKFWGSTPRVEVKITRFQ